MPKIVNYSVEMTDKIISRLAKQLRAGGFFLFGVAERVHHPEKYQLKPIVPAIYQKI